MNKLFNCGFKALLTLSLSAIIWTDPVRSEDRPLVLKRPENGGNVSIVVPRSNAAARGGQMALPLTASGSPVFTAQAFIQTYSNEIGITNPGTQLHLSRVDQDSIGMSHVRYSQVVNDVPVYGAQLTVSLGRDGKVASSTGRLSSLPPISPDPVVSKQSAEQIVAKLWAAEFGRNDETLGTSTLYLFDPNILKQGNSGELSLVWDVFASSADGSRGYHYLVDASTGLLRYKLPLVRHLSRLVFDCSVGNGECYVDQYVPFFDFIFGRSEGAPPTGPNPRHPEAPFETDMAYASLGLSHDYFLQKFQRDGANGLGGIGTGGLAPFSATIAATYAGDAPTAPFYGLSGCPNANWNPIRGGLAFCAGITVPDVVGHEYTHALEHFSVVDQFGSPRGFDGVYESGALSEGFSDVFGEAIERHAFGSNDWVLGVPYSSASTSPFRSLINPESLGGPREMYSPTYYCGAEDNGGIHVNSTVLGHAAYRIAMGGSHNGCSNSGIGQDKEEAIFYRALTRYLSPSSNFISAYIALMQSCIDFFGQSSFECLHTARALNSLRMDQAGTCSGTPPSPIDCDDCPLDPSKPSPGQCGCNVPDLDQNGNGIADCNDINVQALTPPPPVVKAGKKQLSFSLSPVSGVVYILRLETPPAKKGGKPKVKLFRTTLTKGVIKKLTSGTSVNFSYFYMLDGAVQLFSNSSAKKKVKIK